MNYQSSNILHLFSIFEYFENDLDSKIDNLHSRYDGEPSEESHGSSNCWQHVHKLGCPVLGDSVNSGGLKEDPHIPQVQFRIKFLIREIDYRKNKEFPLKPLNSSVVLLRIYMFLNFLYGSIAWAKFVSKYSTDFCLENPETTNPEHGLKWFHKWIKPLHDKQVSPHAGISKCDGLVTFNFFLCHA